MRISGWETARCRKQDAERGNDKRRNTEAQRNRDAENSEMYSCFGVLGSIPIYCCRSLITNHLSWFTVVSESRFIRSIN
jgi:hypothetical protein